MLDRTCVEASSDSDVAECRQAFTGCTQAEDRRLTEYSQCMAVEGSVSCANTASTEDDVRAYVEALAACEPLFVDISDACFYGGSTGVTDVQ